AVIPPIALDGPALTIRKFSKTPYKINDLIKFGSMNSDIAELMSLAVKFRQNVVISGGTGSGKTTLLNVLSSYIPDDERIVTIEDSAELQLPQNHVIRMEARPPNIEGKGRISIRDLVINSLRMRPDRIVVGECRGGESLDMLQAMNTGHDGSLTTLHANTPRDALSRLETMVLMSGMELPSRAIREQIAMAVNIIVQQSRLADGTRKITHVTEITGVKDMTIEYHDIMVFKQTGISEEGKILGSHAATGYIPRFIEKLIEKGVNIPLDIFKTK
ncbi:MAG: Flp pilus assembly protein TadA, partial [uncultured bacterium]